MQNLTDDFTSIVLNNTPLIDVRAPIEFEKGAFKNAVNLPILNDKQRELVGTKYKQEGNEAAVKLAEELIQLKGKDERVSEWKEFLKKYSNAYIYCFRGGQRSGISQEWLAENGIEIPRLKGGYKLFRNFLMEKTLEITKNSNTIILGGKTGSGKTLLIEKLKNAIDLEKIANHRGSSFGNYVNAQPTQINFENNLAYELIKFNDKKFKNLVIEHESHNIGKSFIPKDVYENLMDGKLIILEVPIEERVEITFDDYITKSLETYLQEYDHDGINQWSIDVNKNLDKMKKRLGSKSYIDLKTIFTDCLEIHLATNETQCYKQLIKILLEDYYDPMYEYQIKKTEIPIIFRGNFDEILNFINELS